ncbi:autonomous glycyl radical cofactor GrcA, partial [Vibrio anguillarum]
MIQGIQITKAANDELINSIWLLDTEKNEARCVAAASGYEADQVVAVDALGEFESREVAIETAPRIEGGQHLNVNVL